MLSDEGLLFIQLDDLWVNVESIVAVRSTPEGGSRLYCDQAHSFLVSVSAAEVLVKLREAVGTMHDAGRPQMPPQIPVPQQYLSTYSPQPAPPIYRSNIP